MNFRWGPKMPYFDMFAMEFKKTIAIFCNQYPKIYRN